MNHDPAPVPIIGRQSESENTFKETAKADREESSTGEVVKRKRLIHNHSGGHRGKPSREYVSWHSMRQRCSDPKAPHYKHYGGRGITVCEQWQKSFLRFLEDMGPRPIGKTLGRIDNNGNYCPENCAWMTNREQALNRSDSRLLTFNGETMTITEWEAKTGFSSEMIGQRLKRGWPVWAALTHPKVFGKPTQFCEQKRV